MVKLSIPCPHCDAPLPVSPEAVIARDMLTCEACSRPLDLDPTRALDEAKAQRRRTFSSTGPFPLQLRRYRVALQPIVPPDALPAGTAVPLLATFPALGPRPFALGENQDQALEALKIAAKDWQQRGNVGGELPPSDADDSAPWLPFEA